MESDLVRCSEFAAMRGVSRGRVSQWISEGKIGPEAIVGAGRQTRLRPDIAISHLRERLDISQRFGLNGVSTRLGETSSGGAPPSLVADKYVDRSGEIVSPALPKPSSAAFLADKYIGRYVSPAPAAQMSAPPEPPPEVCEPKAPASTPPPVLPVADSVETRIKAEKLRQAELTTRRAEEADRLSRGVYILAKSARAENVRIAAKLFEAFDGALADFASALAAKYQIPQRDSLHLLRSELRRVRERVSTEFAMAAAAEPETIEDTDTHDEPRS